MKLTMTRRGFFHSSLIALLGWVGFTQTARAKDKKLGLVSENDPTAKVLKYKHDAEKSERKDKSQTCANCIHYAKTGKVGKQEVGKCNLITTGANSDQKMVTADGWCASWVKKP